MRGLIIALAAFGLGAYTMTGDEVRPVDASMPDANGAMSCDAAAARSFVGKQATQAAGTEILKVSGARSLRWGPPGGAWMMDYRQDRVNVLYDDTSTITDVTCG